MSKTIDGMDGEPASRCANIWAVYQQMRDPPRTHAERAAAFGGGGASAAGAPTECTFGAPLVGRALQRLGALDDGVDVRRLTPASFLNALLAPPASFGRAISVR